MQLTVASAVPVFLVWGVQFQLTRPLLSAVVVTWSAELVALCPVG